jgi:hypothetical protein
MEIGPITGIRAIPAIKAPRNEQQVSAIFDIENAAGPLDDNFAQSGGNQAGGQDDDSAESVEPAESPLEASADGSSSAVNFFA